MQLRHARMADLPVILDIEQENFAASEQIAPGIITSYVTNHSETCLVVEEEGQVLAYVLALPSLEAQLTDSLYTEEALSGQELPYLLVASLSISPAYQGQGLGSLLLAGLKEIAHHRGHQGIGLACHEELISYYVMNGFSLLGLSASQLAGQTWYDLYWASSQNRENLHL